MHGSQVSVQSLVGEALATYPETQLERPGRELASPPSIEACSSSLVCYLVLFQYFGFGFVVCFFLRQNFVHFRLIILLSRLLIFTSALAAFDGIFYLTSNVFTY